jgi:tetratricopeptide (TPR) repeat protein
MRSSNGIAARREQCAHIYNFHQPHLQEHETALRYFQRALQLDPTMPYAYTLAGHEYFANEDFEKGITCYRNAIRIDPRHYNAWYVASVWLQCCNGLG